MVSSLFVPLLVFTASCYAAAAGEIDPDTSEKCLSCEATIQELELKWTDESSVQDILDDLKKQCKSLDFGKRKICDGLVEVLVQIPPALFDGMADLAWPMPLAPCALLKQCFVNCCPEDGVPEQVHLSVTSNDLTKMAVSWVSLNQSASVVQYGASPGDLTMVATGTISTYTSAGWVGTIHRVLMTDLTPGNSYYYRVGDGAAKWSETYLFKVTVPGQDLSFAILGDMAYDEFSDNTVAVLNKLVDDGEIDCIIHSGDISYADGYEPHWDDFLNKVQPVAARVPYMVSPGNHEFWFNFSSYKARFFMPGVNDEGGSGDNMFFSWTLGNAHFVSMNSETAIDTANFTDYEMQWVEADLKTVDRAVTPFVVANFHRPMYCSNDGQCGGYADHLKDSAEDIFYDNGVDVVIAGHVHEYERTLPVYKGQTMGSDYNQPTAPSYFLQGASGNREGNKGSIPEDTADWSAAIFNEVGLAVMKITASTIDWTYYATPGGTEMVELDHALITK